jgi:FkbM family methyltransferase
LYIRRKPRLAAIALRLLPDVAVTLKVGEVGRLRVRLRRHRSFWLRSPLAHEDFVVGCFQRLVRPGDVVYDVGANIGLHTRLLCSRFGAGEVVAFEPMTENVALLRANVALGGPQCRVRVVPAAVSDSDRREALQVDDVMSQSAALDSVTGGAASGGRRQYGLPPRTEEVDVVRLDSVVDRDRLPAPALIKIDVEGAEASVLRGAAEVLRRYRPALVVELHGTAAAREVFRILHDYGYACYGYVSSGGEGRKYKRVTPEDAAGLVGDYDLHHLVAAAPPDDAELRSPV